VRRRLTAVEAPVHDRLDATAGRLEQRGHRQGGAGHRPARRIPAHPTEQLAQDQDRAGVDAGQQGGEQPVDQGAVDQPVDLVEAVPQDRDPDGSWDQRKEDEEQHIAQEPVRLRDQAHAEERCRHRGGVGEPLELLSLDPAGPTKTLDDRGGR
jgi:hypothetical protein